MPKIKVCPYCAQEFSPAWPSQLTCRSAECKAKAKRIREKKYIDKRKALPKCREVKSWSDPG